MIDECLVVEFRVTGDDCPLSDATRATGVAVDARPPQRRADGNALLWFSSGDGAERLADVLDADDRLRYLHVAEADGRVNFRCLSKHPCVVHELVNAGFLVESVRYRDGAELLTGAVVGRKVLRGVLDTAAEAGGVTLQRVNPLGSEDDETVARRYDVTAKQEAALRAAMEAGYFDVPRGATASEVAATLGIGKSAFLERLRRGLDSFLQGAFGEPQRVR